MSTSFCKDDCHTNHGLANSCLVFRSLTSDKYYALIACIRAQDREVTCLLHSVMTFGGTSLH